MALRWVSMPLSEWTIRASLSFQLIKSGKPFFPSEWLAFAIVIGTKEAVAATPANVAVPVKKFLLDKFNFFNFFFHLHLLEWKL